MKENEGEIRRSARLRTKPKIRNDSDDEYLLEKFESYDSDPSLDEEEAPSQSKRGRKKKGKEEVEFTQSTTQKVPVVNQ